MKKIKNNMSKNENEEDKIDWEKRSMMQRNLHE
jgi:hypothetical protein